MEPKSASERAVKHNSQPGERDEIMRKFSKSFRKLMETRDPSNGRVSPVVSRSVKFNPQVMETSIGGTNTPSRIKDKTPVELDFSSYKENTGTALEKTFKDTSIALEKTFKQSSSARTKLKDSAKDTNTNKPLLDSKSSVSDAKSKVLNKRTPTKVQDSKTKSGGKAGKLHSTVVEKEHKLANGGGPVKAIHPGNLLHTPDRRHTLENSPTAVRGTPECFAPVAFETPQVKKSKNRWSSGSANLRSIEDSSGMVVAVRVRPFSTRELTQKDIRNVISMNDNETTVSPERGEKHHFAYDYSFPSFDKESDNYCGQEHVYELLARPMLSKAFEGYNTCLFAYGQTGSGKSYSIMGHGDDIGIIPRFCDELFIKIDSCKDDTVNVEISFFEIYNEKIHDLLGPYSKDKNTGKKPNLKVREHPVLGPYVEGLSSFVVESFDDINSWLNVGNKHRATASTGMNDKSSRSHSVFTMVMTQTKTDLIDGEKHEHSITSKINLVDLAGSERQSLAKTSGDRLREGASINKSLHTLGKVISLLSEQSNLGKKKKVFIPYRDSVLTWLLKESIGGNSKTAMLATISPAHVHIEETLSTLRYAKQARNIINVARVNEDPKARLIRELKAEIERLKSQTGYVSEDVIGSSLAEIASLKYQLLEREEAMNELTKSWQDRLKKSEERKLEESRLLEKSGIAFKIDNKLPNLVNLNEDPQLSEMLLYVLQEGVTRVGRMKENSDLEIQLNGPLIADSHCTITNDGKTVKLEPLKDAPTYVNGNLISEALTIKHGDRVILGGDHYFRFNNPLEVAEGRKSLGASGTHPTQQKDFEFARQELINVQNARLEAELEEARKKHEAELAKELEKQRSEAEFKRKMEVEKTKQEANLRLSLQKHEYEDKLENLEKALKEQRSKKLLSDQQRSQQQSLLKTLENQKMMLEQEVLANRKQQELQTRAALKAVEQSRVEHSKIVDKLEQERQRVQKEVLQLTAKKQQRGVHTPRVMTPRTPGVATEDKTNLYRTALLVREANKISQHLKKDTVFSREEVIIEGKTQLLLKVFKPKLRIRTFWTLSKFEDRLLQMREMYQADLDGEGGVEDDVFYDPNDEWEKEEKVGMSPEHISPKVLRQLWQPVPVPRLSFDSVSSTGSKKRTNSNTQDIIGNNSVFGDGGDSIDTQPQPVISLCRDLIASCLDHFKGCALQESISDKILRGCERVKVATATLLDAYNQAADDPINKGKFVDEELVRTTSIQLASGIEGLLSQCSLICSQYESMGSAMVKELSDTLVNTVRKLGSHMVLFLQGCENDIDSMVQESASVIMDCVYYMCKLCGELSIATDTNLVTLGDAWEQDGEGDEEEQRLKLGHDVRSQFLAGCDVFLDKTLQGGLKAMDEAQMKIMAFNDDSCVDINIGSEDIIKQVELVVASCRVLMEKTQEVQVSLDNTMRESTSEFKSQNYYSRNYSRSQGLLTHITNMADGVSLLVTAAESLLTGSEESSLRRLYRCTEMIQKACVKLMAASMCDPSTSISSSDSTLPEATEISLLSESQLETLDFAAAEIKLSTNSLVAIIKKRLEGDCGVSGKGKRVLPKSPGVVGSPLVSPHKVNVKKNLVLVDLIDN